MQNWFRKYHHSTGGFTLLEVIVTAIIVAVLAAIAIPVYTSYIEAQKQETVDNLAATGAGSANSYYRRTGSDPDSAALDLFLSSPNSYTVSVSGGAVTVTDAEDNTITSTVSYR